MKAKKTLLLAMVLCGTLIVLGCAKYKVTHQLEQPIDNTLNCRIGDIRDELPFDFDEEGKPTLEEIDKFRDRLRIVLQEKAIFRAVQLTNPEAEYEVTGSILDFRKGSGAARFFIGFGAGNARLTAALRLEDRNTGEVLFAGNFKQEVSSWAEKGELIFQRTANDFAKALEKQMKELAKKK